MKSKYEHDHIKVFQQLFVLDQTQNNIRQTEQNLFEARPTLNMMPQSMMFQTPPLTNQKLKKKQIQIISINQQRSRETNIKMFSFIINRYIFQVVIGYAVTLGLMLLNKLVYFPFFQGLMIIIISLSTKPFNITNLFILLALPMAIANYNLQIWVLTYPQIIICYFSRYLFGNRNPRMLIWIITTTLYAAFGFMILPGISVRMQQADKFILYYIFPWMLLLIKLISGFLNHIIFDSNLFLLQIPLFLTGLSYGMLLTLDITSIQFWYLIITLTLDIINTRYQFLLTLFKRITKQPNLRSIVQAQSSGYLAINSLHFVLFVYAVIQIGLNTSHFTYSIKGYLNQWYKPIVVWIFFIIYELIAIGRLWNWQNLLIIGYQKNTWTESFKRALGLSLGLWFFYLGLGIPSVIFIV